MVPASDIRCIVAVTPTGELVQKYFTQAQEEHYPDMFRLGLPFNAIGHSLLRWDRLVPDADAVLESTQGLVIYAGEIGSFPVRSRLIDMLTRLQSTHNVNVFGGAAVMVTLDENNWFARTEPQFLGARETLVQLGRAKWIESFEFRSATLKLDLVPQPLAKLIDRVYLVLAAIKPLLKKQDSSAIGEFVLHLSVWENERNLFWDPNDPHTMSVIAKGFVCHLGKNHGKILSVICRDEETLRAFARLRLFEYGGNSLFTYPDYFDERAKSTRVGWGKNFAIYRIPLLTNLYLLAYAALTGYARNESAELSILSVHRHVTYKSVRKEFLALIREIQRPSQPS
jgi:hypothetical protein